MRAGEHFRESTVPRLSSTRMSDGCFYIRNDESTFVSKDRKEMFASLQTVKIFRDLISDRPRQTQI